MKKFLSLALATLLILCLGISVFAVEEDGYTDQETVTITKSYKLIGAGSSPAETFTLQQIDSGVVTDGDATAAPNLGTITGAAFAESDATADGTQKDITITLPTFTTVGVYEYTLREVVGTTAGVIYFGNDIKLVVTVINDADGKLRVASVHTEAEGDQKSSVFENTYSAGTLSITKTVDGILGDKNKYFEFTVTLTGEEGKAYGDEYKVTGGSSTDNPEKIFIGTPTTFYLKHGDTLSIANLPYGVTYTVVEESYAGEGYETEWTNDEGTIEAALQTAAFTNTKGGMVDTGVLLDSLPYVIILALVVVAGASLMLKKRHSEN